MTNDQYFPLEVNMLHNDCFFHLQSELGVEGFGIYVRLLMELRLCNNYSCSTRWLGSIARIIGVEEQKVRRVVMEFDLFELEGEGEQQHFWSPYMERVLSRLEEKRQQLSMAGKKSAQARAKTANEPGCNKPMNLVATACCNQVATEEKSKEEKRTTTTTTTKEKAAAVVAVVDLNMIAATDAVLDSATAVVDSLYPSPGEHQPPKPLSPQQSWYTYINQAINDQAWLELQAMHSGMGLAFITQKGAIFKAFKEHVLMQGSEANIGCLHHAKSYFANFIRRGSKTRQRLDEMLKSTRQQQTSQNPFRHEQIHPTTRERTYCGLVIPAHAPPRPTENAVWSNNLSRWSE